jgi:hypothetical protein
MRLPLKWKLYQTARRYLPFLKLRPPEADRQAAMTLRPVRNGLLSWEQNEKGDTILTVPLGEKMGPIRRLIIKKVMRLPNQRKVELDEVGGFVWELCDGNLTVEGIVQRTSKHYKMNRREAEVSVTMFLQMLHERNFIGFYKKVSGKDRSKAASSSAQKSRNA